MANSVLQEVLRRLKYRLLVVHGISGLGWGLVSAIGLLFVGAWADLVFDLAPGLRVATNCLAAVALGGLALGMLYFAFRLARPALLARRLDNAAGTRGEILSGVDLLAEQAEPASLTGGLAQMAVQRAASLAGGISSSVAIPSRPVRWSFGSLLGLAAMAALLLLFVPNLAQTEWRRFSDPFGDHPPFSRVRFHVEPGNAKVVFSKGLDIKVTASGETVDRVDLYIETLAAEVDRSSKPETLPMFPEADGQWRASVANITQPMRYYVGAAGARSPRFKIEVITVPKLEDVQFQITPPSYTGHPPYRGTLPKGGIAGLAGTEVKVTARSNRPLSGGSLVIDPGQRTVKLAPLAPSSQEAAGSFRIERDGKLQLHVIDTEGQQSVDLFTAPITVLPDERPFVRLMQPREVSFATPDVTLPVVIAAEDDYGLSKAQVFRNLNDSRFLPADVEIARPPPTRWSGMVRLPLSTYGLKPGDAIKVFARVEDNDPHGAKGAESAIAIVKIISQDDFDRMVQTQKGMELILSKYQQARRRIEKMADELEKLKKELEGLSKDSSLAEEKQKELQRLTKRLREESQALRDQAKQKLPYDLDKELNADLKKMADALEQAAEQAEQLAGEPGLKTGDAAARLADIQKQLQKKREEFEQQAMQPIDHLAAVYPLMEDQARFMELYQRQRSLAERMSALKGHDREDNPELKGRMRDLESEQQHVRDELHKLLDDIESHVAKLPDDKRLDQLRDTATEFTEAVRACGASEAMSEATGALAEFAGTKAQAEALQAADLLEKFISRCKGMQNAGNQAGGMCLKFRPGMSECMSKTISQLLAGAGMKPGSSPGMGTGNGGGYSTTRSTMDNVGLYGNLPVPGDASGSGSDRNNQSAGAAGTLPGAGENGDPTAVQAAGHNNASGNAEARVPSQYRRRVGAYFQRIADESGK